MKAEYVVNQLKAVLPLLTDYFHDVLNVVSMTRVGSTVAAVTATPHGLQNNDIVSIAGAKCPVLIESITRNGNIATAVTADNHDLTENYQDTCKIYGADQAEYNGSKKLLSVPNRRTFTFEVEGNPITPATGPIYLDDDYYYRGYNGRYAVTVVNATTFTFQTNKTPLPPAQGDIKVKTAPRISSAAIIDKALDGYTSQPSNKMWAFVEMGDVTASKDRYQTDDATYKAVAGTAYRQRLVSPFSVYVVTPSTASISARNIRDLMSDIAVHLFKSLLRVKFPTGFYEGPIAGATFISHGFYSYQGAYYVHVFNFETVYDIVYEDTVADSLNVAFRDIHIDYLNKSGAVKLQSDINLDDQPL